MACLWEIVGWASAAAALLLLGIVPAIAVAGYGHGLLPSCVHLVTLGLVLSLHYAQQAARWERETAGRRTRAAFRALALAIWAGHGAGVAAFALGLARFASDGGALAYLGGHYLIPSAIALSLGADAARATLRRRIGLVRPTGPGWVRQLPALGLVVTMSLGVMLLLDRRTDEYAFYGLPHIALHALAAAFLFALPVLRRAGEAAERKPEGPSESGLPWLFLLAALGLCAVALDGRTFSHGLEHGFALGLTVLGGVALAAAWPGPERGFTPASGLRRASWAVFGLLLLQVALAAWRETAVAEALPLASRAALWFLFGLAAPQALLGLLAHSAAPDLARRTAQSPQFAARDRAHAAWLAGALVSLAGQAMAAEMAIQAGVLLGLLGWTALGWIGWRDVRSARGAGRSC